MPRMAESEVKALVEAEKGSAVAGATDSALADERADALAYYLGDVSEDMPTLPDRSKAVSNDVADTIEGMLPSLIEIFTSSDDVVMFDPTGMEDEEAAKQETEYVNYVFNQQNRGFLILYSFIKDALLSKNGLVKVVWEETEEEDRHTYTDIGEDSLAALKADETIEIVDIEEVTEGEAA